MQYLQTRSPAADQQLLTDSASFGRLAGGSSSLRRFNAAFAEHYRDEPDRRGATRAPRRSEGDACDA